MNTLKYWCNQDFSSEMFKKLFFKLYFWLDIMFWIFHWENVYLKKNTSLKNTYGKKKSVWPTVKGKAGKENLKRELGKLI